MEILLNIVVLIIGVLLLMKGADVFVSSSSSIARKFKIPPIIIGLTIVSFGTSAPELAVSVSGSLQASIAGTTADIAMGNVVGSNIVNLLMVLGLSAVVTPIIVDRKIIKNEFLFLILITLILVAFSFDALLGGGVSNAIQRGEGLVMLLLVVLFIVILVRGANKTEETEEIEVLSMPKAIFFLVLGLAGIVIGAQCVTQPATTLGTKAAVSMGIDQSMATTLMGLTVVAFGTSLPELITSVIAAKKGENDIALGNVIGSNVFNTILIVGASSVVAPLGINNAVLIDIIIMTVVTVIVLALALKGKLTKKNGLFLVLLYLVYLTYIIIRTVV